MFNLNPIFQKQKPNQQQLPALPHSPKVVNTQPNKQTAIAVPQITVVQIDRHDMKFPVTTIQKEQLRRLARLSKMKRTEYNTQLLTWALDNCKILPSTEYKDTRVYMHANPTLPYYDKLHKISESLGLSERETLARLVNYALSERSTI